MTLITLGEAASIGVKKVPVGVIEVYKAAKKMYKAHGFPQAVEYVAIYYNTDAKEFDVKFSDDIPSDLYQELCDFYKGRDHSEFYEYYD